MPGKTAPPRKTPAGGGDLPAEGREVDGPGVRARCRGLQLGEVRLAYAEPLGKLGLGQSLRLPKLGEVQEDIVCLPLLLHSPPALWVALNLFAQLPEAVSPTHGISPSSLSWSRCSS